MRICPKCNTTTAGEQLYCSTCGKKLIEFVKTISKEDNSMKKKLSFWKRTAIALLVACTALLAACIVLAVITVDQVTYADYWIQVSHKEREVSYFFERYAVITDDHSNYYHTYKCDDWDRDSFRIHNIDAAEYDGYKECPNCH